MFNKIFLSVIFFLFIGSIVGNQSCFADKDIFEIQFDSGDAGLSDEFEREQVVSMQSRNDGADNIQEGIMKIVELLVKFMGFFGFIFLFYTGISIIIKGGGDELDGAKKKFLWTIFALLMTFLVEPMIRTVFFGGTSTQKAGDVYTNSESVIKSAKIGVKQIEGLIGYIETFVILLALVMMMKSAVSMIFANSEESKITEQKNTIIWTGVGLIVILLSEVFVYYGVYGNRVTGEGRDFSKVIGEVSGVIGYSLGFLGSIAVAMIIYGGSKVILSAGEDAEEGKTIIKNVVIGSVVISIAYVLVFTLIGGKT